MPLNTYEMPPKDWQRKKNRHGFRINISEVDSTYYDSLPAITYGGSTEARLTQASYPSNVIKVIGGTEQPKANRVLNDAARARVEYNNVVYMIKYNTNATVPTVVKNILVAGGYNVTVVS